ncbi:RNA pseudouridine synthase 5 isoform X1 [Cucumis melo]|uniref:RNA pseudouridine synthase 5 isoform X1 n=1 Tax=Cucumis melo TaxID=3656 RepID=A0A1S3CPE8_CUCME|nr:RNA pseudouridine synthase 5 isoform X1 [Cucumis melo]
MLLGRSFQVIGIPWPDLNDGLFYNDVVKPPDSGKSLIHFYSCKYKSSAPLEGWLQRIKNEQITIDGEVITDPETILRIGSELVYRRLPWKEPDTPFSLEILYEDDEMIALNKPSGLQVLPGGVFQQRTVLTQLQWWSSDQSFSISEELHPVPVHRLGRGTSGILLCAKTKLARTQFAAYFADGTSSVIRNSTSEEGTKRKISKIYRALVTGIIHDDEVSVDQPIGRMQYPGVAQGLYVATPSGKPACSKVNVLERDEQGEHTLVQVEIQSGRPHQIRIHLSSIGHPLLGDPLYVAGGQPNCLHSEVVNQSFAEDGGYERPMKPVPGDCGYYLHAHQLILYHPKTNEKGFLVLLKVVKIVAPLPPILRTRSEAEDFHN